MPRGREFRSIVRPDTGEKRRRILFVIASVAVTASLHLGVPAGPHAWHWLHLAGQKLYLVPIVAAAAWFGPAPTLWATATASLLFGIHVARDWQGFAMVQADQVAEIANFWIVGIVSAVLFQRQRRAFEEVHTAHQETLDALASSLELRERHTAGHSRRVRDYALLIARTMGLQDLRLLDSLALGALLHDIGKIGIPDRILLKPGALTPEEWQEMRRHPELGAALIGDISFLGHVRELVLSHHENFDGTGYPRELAGERIPLGARVFSVADAFDALTSHRPYQRAVSVADARVLIARGRGSRFDPRVVEAFLAVPIERFGGRHDATRAHALPPTRAPSK